MNRVVLSGRLAGRPKLSYTPCGVAVAEFRLLFPRERVADPSDEITERIDCIASREAAQDLTTWGDRDYRVNLEGRLRGDTYWDCDGKRVTGLRVFVDRCYFVDPIANGLGTDPNTCPRIPLPTAIRVNGG